MSRLIRIFYRRPFPASFPASEGVRNEPVPAAENLGTVDLGIVDIAQLSLQGTAGLELSVSVGVEHVDGIHVGFPDSVVEAWQDAVGAAAERISGLIARAEPNGIGKIETDARVGQTLQIQQRGDVIGTGGCADPVPVFGAGAALEGVAPAAGSDSVGEVAVAVFDDVFGAEINRIVSVDDIHLVFHEVLRPLQGAGASGGLCRGDFHERKNIVEVIRVLHEELSDLPLISEAGDGARFASGTVQRGQKHSREDRDDRNRYYDHLLNIQYGVY